MVMDPSGPQTTVPTSMVVPPVLLVVLFVFVPPLSGVSTVSSVVSSPPKHPAMAEIIIKATRASAFFFVVWVIMSFPCSGVFPM